MYNTDVLTTLGLKRRRENDAKKHKLKYDPVKRRMAYERAKLKKMEMLHIERERESEELRGKAENGNHQSSLLEVPYICYHCGGRSDNLSSLESHIKHMHMIERHGKRKSQSEDSPVDHLKINEIVEVQIKEEPDFILPLDLSRREQEAAVWIKQEPETDFDHPIPSEDPLDISTTLPKIRVASEEKLKAPNPPMPPYFMSPPAPPGFPFGRFVNQLLPTQGNKNPIIPLALPPRIAFANALCRPPPPPLAPKIPHSFPAPPPQPRMPNHFSQASPYLLEVPYICFHCGGRSADIDTLRNHIETMHDPVAIMKEKELAMAKKKVALEAIASLKKPKTCYKVPDDIQEYKGVYEPILPPIPILPMLPKSVPIRIKKEKVPKEPRPPRKTKRELKMENKPFACPFCNFRATNFPGLVLHAKAIHEKERAKSRLEAEAAAPPVPEGKKVLKKPYHCLFCNYRGVQRQTVKKHMYAIHAKQKNLQCPFCTHRSAYSENMKWHILSKHKNKCPHCEFRANSKAILLAHEKSNCEIVAFEELEKKLPGRKPKRPGRPKKVNEPVQDTNEQNLSNVSFQNTNGAIDDSSVPLDQAADNIEGERGEGNIEGEREGNIEGEREDSIEGERQIGDTDSCHGSFESSNVPTILIKEEPEVLAVIKTENESAYNEYAC